MENEISNRIIGSAIEVHRVLGGPGLLEGLYESAFCHELSLRGLTFERQLPVPVKYKDTVVREPLFVDILVENLVIVEVKATESIHPIHRAQLLTYLRLTEKRVGLIINFGQESLREGIARMVNGL